MNYKEQIKLIQKVTGLNQDEIARRLEVTFAALNRWLNDRAVPRENLKKKINKLYTELTGEESKSENIKEAKKQFIKKKQKEHKNIL
ncbi:MAG: helix-turn-helix transcriptional regulator [Candidatus Melainabacteria bacterium]|nr:helix-turn-helix transcriptional regulator [Candidatus Melainabacteria bacterium]